jgi:hypothetical protein
MRSETNTIPQVSIILIRETAEQMSGSGCCGRVEGDPRPAGGGDAFREVRRRQEAFGILHRAIVEFFAAEQQRNELTIVTVDPRNQPYLIPKLLKDVWRYRPGWGTGLCTALQFFSLPAVIVNGRILSCRGRLLDPDALCHAVNEILAAANAQSLRREYS